MQPLQALKGVSPIVAATVLAEIGDLSRFAHPRQLAAYFGLAPGQHSCGGTVRSRGITKAGSSMAGRCRVKSPGAIAPHRGSAADERALPASFTRYRCSGLEGSATPSQQLSEADHARKTLGRRDRCSCA
ncbi:transposase [Bradyrhizobium sp. CCBAU 53421]|uniref:transposase n=1 Tax=Bradyrhizobium sp. CCBAU 53421 TaxID=1325120 RepID=UPI0035304080